MATDRELRYDTTENRLYSYREADDSWQIFSFRQMEEAILRLWGTDVDGIVLTPELNDAFQDWVQGSDQNPPSLEEVRTEQEAAALPGDETDPATETEQGIWSGLTGWWPGGGTDKVDAPPGSAVDAPPGDEPQYGDLTIGLNGDVWVYAIDENGQDNFVKMREFEEEVGEYTFAQHADLILERYTDDEGGTDGIEGLRFDEDFKLGQIDLLEDKGETTWTAQDAISRDRLAALLERKDPEPTDEVGDWYDQLRALPGYSHLPEDRGDLGLVVSRNPVTGNADLYENGDYIYVRDPKRFRAAMDTYIAIAKAQGIDVGKIEEAPWTRDDARENAEGAGPGFMADYTPKEGWFMRRRTMNDPYDTEAEAEAGAIAQGYTNYEIVPNPDGRGVVISVGAAGKKYTSSQAAEADKPDGMRVKAIQQDDGSILYGYEYAPEDPKMLIDTWDEVIIDAYQKGGPAAAIEADRLRDRIEAKAVTPLEALEFAWKVAEDPDQFMRIAKLAMSLGSQQGATSDFMSAVTSGASSIVGADTFDDVVTVLENTPPSVGTDFNTLFDEAVVGGDPELSPEERAAHEAQVESEIAERAALRSAYQRSLDVTGAIHTEADTEATRRAREDADPDEPGEYDRLWGIYYEEESDRLKAEADVAWRGEQEERVTQLDPSNQPVGYSITRGDGASVEVREDEAGIKRVYITDASGQASVSDTVPAWAWPEVVGRDPAAIVGKETADEGPKDLVTTDTSTYTGQPTPPVEFDMTAFEKNVSAQAREQEMNRRKKRYEQLPGITRGKVGTRGGGI